MSHPRDGQKKYRRGSAFAPRASCLRPALYVINPPHLANPKFRVFHGPNEARNRMCSKATWLQRMFKFRNEVGYQSLQILRRYCLARRSRLDVLYSVELKYSSPVGSLRLPRQCENLDRLQTDALPSRRTLVLQRLMELHTCTADPLNPLPVVPPCPKRVVWLDSRLCAPGSPIG